MGKLKLRRKTKRKLLIGIPVQVLVLAGAWVVFHPAKPGRVEYKIFAVESELQLENMREDYLDEDNIYNQRIRTSLEGMSENPDDYCKVMLDFYFTNCMPFQIMDIHYTVEGEPESSILIGKNDDHESTPVIYGWSEGSGESMSLFVYRDGRTDEEILDYLGGVTVRITYESAVSSEHTQTFRLKNRLTPRKE